jgi:alpha/beta superfamily hydrolase
MNFQVEVFAYFSFGSSAARKFQMQGKKINVNISIRNVSSELDGSFFATHSCE